MFKIPSAEKKVYQDNESSVLGTVHSSFGLDLTSNRGVIRVHPRMLKTTDSATTANLGVSVGFKRFTGTSTYIYAVAGTKVAKASSQFSAFAIDAISGTPTTNPDISDIETFNGSLYVTSNTALNELSSLEAWSAKTPALGTGSPHMLTTYGNRLYVTNLSSKIGSMDTAGTLTLSGTYTIQLTDARKDFITLIRGASDRIWVFTLNLDGGKGYIGSWDGASAQLKRKYRLKSQGILAAVIKDDIPYVMDTDGSLLVYDGGTFIEVARLPISPKYLTNATSSKNDRFIHPNGMTVVDGKIRMLINNKIGDNAGSIKPELPSGIWEYDKNVGLYHLAPLSYCAINGSITDFGQNRLSRVGALSEAKYYSESSSANGTMLAGAQYYTDATSTAYGIWIDDTNDTVQKAGYIVTVPMESEGIEDTFQKAYIRHKRMLDSADKIVVKVRSNEDTPTEGTITWSSTTSFTTTAGISGYTVGDEVEITQGTGGGLCAHISSISVSGGTYTVAIDETATGATGTAKARFSKWQKIGTISNQVAKRSNQISIDRPDTWIQMKIFAIFKGKDEIEQILVTNTPNKS